ncbi:MAG: DUF2207 domain-containing protein [Endomicrobium sp.]|jgi:uncharacterized membrane protein YgcG|nr:DUF2207 domain-containing protein [Endomicrobium sp.]
MKRIRRIFLAIFFVFTFCAAANAQEKIFDFDVEMRVQKDGSAIVLERISLNSDNIKIRRGIYRDLPNAAQVPIRFISLTMDGAPCDSFLERKNSMLRINFGGDNFISKGRHVYELTYKVERLVGSFDDYDEVYWNVTGNGWDFTIERASFRILLPKEAVIKSDLTSLYTGKKGAKGKDAIASEDNFFKTTKPLYPGEGFTVAVAFTKGAAQSYVHKEEHIAAVDPAFVLFYASLIFAVLLFYYVYTWFKVGKDPVDTIVTEFVPPKDISPAFMRCIWKRTEDKKMFAASLVSLAMKGKIEISEEKSFLSKNAVLHLKDKNTDGLPKEEKTILTSFFNGKKSFALTNANWSALNSCINSINNYFKREKKKYLIANAKYIAPPIIALILMQAAFIGNLAPAIFLNFQFCIFIVVISNIPAPKLLKPLLFFAVLAFYFIFFYSILKEAPAQYIVAEVLFAAAALGLVIYASIIDNLTHEGRALLIKIKGFYRYMTVAEERRVAMSNPVDAERIFADYLPYAFAFGMENKWMSDFEKILPDAAMNRYLNTLGGRNALQRGLILSSIANAAPKNRGSGAGGGGFSGGGFGGGGGGGR